LAIGIGSIFILLTMLFRYRADVNLGGVHMAKWCCGVGRSTKERGYDDQGVNTHAFVASQMSLGTIDRLLPQRAPKSLFCCARLMFVGSLPGARGRRLRDFVAAETREQVKIKG
jgi:hypothetical protein